MEKLKAAFNLIIGLVLILTLAACGEEKKKRATPAIYRTSGNVQSVDETLDSDVLSGQITGLILANFHNQADSTFQDSVEAFATGFMDPYSPTKGLGTVSSVNQNLNQSGTTGVRFSVNLCSNSNKIGSGVTGPINVSTAQIKLFIKDSYAANGTGDFGIIEVGGYSLQSNSQLYTGGLKVIFKNDFGSIELNGQYTDDGKNLYGILSFDNTNDETEGRPFSGDLGVFYIPVSDISKGCR